LLNLQELIILALEEEILRSCRQEEEHYLLLLGLMDRKLAD